MLGLAPVRVQRVQDSGFRLARLEFVRRAHGPGKDVARAGGRPAKHARVCAQVLADTPACTCTRSAETCLPPEPRSSYPHVALPCVDAPV